MSGNTTTSAVSDREASASKEGMSLEEKIGMAKKFDREMKDYAKATVKEFLGIYGYEEDVDINIDESESHKTGETSTSQAVDKQTETEPTTSTVSTMTGEADKGSDRPVSSVSISSSTSNGNADLTRFCITMSLPRPGADSLEGYTTLRFWNCIMCSTAFVGTKPEIIQRVHHPQLFTYQPEWLSHAGVCNRCQKTLTMQAPKITIYAISETPQRHHGYNGAAPSAPAASAPGVSTLGPITLGTSIPSTSIPHAAGTFVPGTYLTGTTVPVVMCNALPGQCNCARGGHNHVPVVSSHGYQGVNVPVVTKAETKPACTDAAHVPTVTQYIPITCTQ